MTFCCNSNKNRYWSASADSPLWLMTHLLWLTTHRDSTDLQPEAVFNGLNGQEWGCWGGGAGRFPPTHHPGPIKTQLNPAHDQVFMTDPLALVKKKKKKISRDLEAWRRSHWNWSSPCKQQTCHCDQKKYIGKTWGGGADGGPGGRGLLQGDLLHRQWLSVLIWSLNGTSVTAKPLGGWVGQLIGSLH